MLAMILGVVPIGVSTSHIFVCVPLHTGCVRTDHGRSRGHTHAAVRRQLLTSPVTPLEGAVTVELDPGADTQLALEDFGLVARLGAIAL
jgi:hypothetical protein